MSSQVASLLHDDVLDDADTRRGIGSLNFVMGNKVYAKLCSVCQHIVCHWYCLVIFSIHILSNGGHRLLDFFFFFFYVVGSIGWRFSPFSGLCCSGLFKKHRGKLNV